MPVRNLCKCFWHALICLNEESIFKDYFFGVDKFINRLFLKTVFLVNNN